MFAEPSNQEARRLGADALEQLGYQSELATWRNAYLLGATELRRGSPTTLLRMAVSPDVVKALSLPLFFDYLAVRLDGPRAEGKHIVINLQFPDLGERYVLNLENSALTYVPDWQAPDADATVSLQREVLSEIIMGRQSIQGAIDKGLLGVDGDAPMLVELFELIDEHNTTFPVVEPLRPV